MVGYLTFDKWIDLFKGTSSKPMQGITSYCITVSIYLIHWIIICSAGWMWSWLRLAQSWAIRTLHGFRQKDRQTDRQRERWTDWWTSWWCDTPHLGMGANSLQLNKIKAGNRMDNWIWLTVTSIFQDTLPRVIFLPICPAEFYCWRAMFLFHTHCGLVTPYNVTKLGQHSLVPGSTEPFTWNKAD